MSLSFKKRIATSIMLATAIIIAIVFGVVYVIVLKTVYKNIDDDLSFEAHKHTFEVNLSANGIQFLNREKLEELEHTEVQVNPVFLQLMDANGEIVDKSPNLKTEILEFKDQDNYGNPFNSELNNRPIRQVQIPILDDGQVKGYIAAAMSLESSLMVLKNLRYTLFLLFPIILIALYFISSFLAGKSIKPVVTITKTANKITKHNFNERIELPQNKDELYELSNSINALLGRLENALEREKQFTSDASHELRTPLAVLRGTLEVLIRKEREKNEYEDKIKFSLREIDRMADIIDQLLQLARFESNPELNNQTAVSLKELIKQIQTQRAPLILEKNLVLNIQLDKFNDQILVNAFNANLVLDNIIGNAIKYSHVGGIISITLIDNVENVICKIRDEGIGIKNEDLEQIFTPFFRSDALNHKEIKGVGLGLSIAQKAAKSIGAELEIESIPNKGTEFTVTFKQILRKG